MKRFFILLPIAALLLFMASSCKESPKDKITWFEEPGDCIETSSVKVFQALDNNAALARCEDDSYYSTSYYGLIVLLYNDEDKTYYDDQIVKASHGQCFRQVGVYRYETKSNDIKTVPLVKLMD